MLSYFKKFKSLVFRNFKKKNGGNDPPEIRDEDRGRVERRPTMATSSISSSTVYEGTTWDYAQPIMADTRGFSQDYVIKYDDEFFNVKPKNEWNGKDPLGKLK